MPDLFPDLRADHLELLALLGELRGDPATGGPAPAERRRIVHRLVAAAAAHETVEEVVLWPEVRARVAGGDRVADDGVDQEQVAKKLFNELEKTSGGTDAFTTLVHQVASAVRRHVLYEETRVWPGLQAVLRPGEGEALGVRAAAVRHSAPTRPHPHTPPDPRLLQAVGPVVGAVDRARDALHLRR